MYVEDEAEAPVTQALADLLTEINEPTSNRSLLPTLLIQAFGPDNHILNADQQDAQEFYQILSSALGTECDQCQPSHISGLTDLLCMPPPSRVHTGEVRSPFIGLLASRLACTTCDYTEAIRHFTFDNLSCNIPSTYQATLGECLQDYVRLEPLEDARCRRCSLTATLTWLEERSQKPGLPKKVRREVEDRASRVRLALKTNPAMELPGIKMEPGRSRLSTKQSLIAQAPPSLCLHLARSTFSSYGHILKNNALVTFPATLDLAPYMTSGTLRTTARSTMSPPSSRPIRYRLTSVIVHYGSHEDGHYVAFRRGIHGDGATGEEVWWRVSDSRVDRVSLQQVLRENPYILFYERLPEDPKITSVTEALGGTWKEKFRDGTGIEEPAAVPAPPFLSNGHSLNGKPLEKEVDTGADTVADVDVIMDEALAFVVKEKGGREADQRVPEPPEKDPPMV
ncbi:hypothetical protein BJ684DRAFT_12187 [Piptocephalis cylindrospora]|uniref:ubiquitinyl hydrolase 1 n=1 Tax=Piptocephalis cylindrospora TaxID=1907219 RepID=A0A4P9Y292_9FUNG|nr:hypothetical protein BJ684DRAFT_12187 [Piptocephalis cylindrospora]|eukprot:RKP11960.1 hypothetical protein BJ684DRAFT_12187 [Piptocephalis cylindrospora]